MRLLILLLAGALAACSSGIGRAEEEHRIAMQSASSEAEKCQIERKLASAYLAEGAEQKYKDQKLAADMQCLSAQLSSP